MLGRLLQELSWVGVTIRGYRDGGRGFENVLTAEALQALDFLPRRDFLGAVLEAARGADRARTQLISEIEDARITLLPGNHYLTPSGNRHQSQLSVQPDGIIKSPSTFTVIEAKRIRRSTFQAEQLAREYVLALRDSEHRAPILLLIVGSPPPFTVAKHGKLAIPDAISLYLDAVLARAENHSLTTEHARALIAEVVCWITWQEISQIVQNQCDAVRSNDASIQACIDRLSMTVVEAVAWHGK